MKVIESFNSDIVRALTGIQVHDGYYYSLVKMSIEDLNKEVQENLKEFSKILKKGYANDMVKHIKLGGTLPAIIVDPDTMNVLDGSHRIVAYYITNTKEFYALLKIKNNEL